MLKLIDIQKYSSWTFDTFLHNVLHSIYITLAYSLKSYYTFISCFLGWTMPTPPNTCRSTTTTHRRSIWKWMTNTNIYLLNVMRQWLSQSVRHVTMLNYVILFCFPSSEPFTLDSVRILVFVPLFSFAWSEPLALHPLRILVFLPRSFDFNEDVNSRYSADKSTNYIFT